MRKMPVFLSLVLFAALTLCLGACKTFEQTLQDTGGMQLSANEVKQIVAGNTITTNRGETYFFNTNGTVSGRGMSSGKNVGKWNISADGKLCTSNWNNQYVPSSCSKIYYDARSQEKRVLDDSGELFYTITNVVPGNPNNF